MGMFDNLRSRLFLIAMVPIIGMVVATGETAYEKYRIYDQLHIIEPLIMLSRTGSDLVHELQKERGGSVGYLTSRGDEEFRKQAADQRLLTDRRLGEFQERLADVEGIDGIDWATGYLTQARAAVVSRKWWKLSDGTFRAV